MKLTWYSYLVSSVGNCVHKTSTETGLSSSSRSLNLAKHMKLQIVFFRDRA